MDVKRWVSPYAAGTESYKALELVRDRTEPDPDEGPFFVLATDFDAALKDRDALQGKLKVAVKSLQWISQIPIRPDSDSEYERGYMAAQTVRARVAAEALAQIGLPEKEG